MLTEKDYCDKDLTAALKDLGFPTKMVFIGEQATIEIPINSGLIQLYEAQKFLREEKMIGVFVSGFKNGYTFWVNNLLNGDTLYQGFFDNQTGEKYKSHEEALSEGIKEALKILERE